MNGSGFGGSGVGGGGFFGGGGGNAAQRALSGLTEAQIARYRVRCESILRDPNKWDWDLVQMCRALQQAAVR